MLAVENLDFAYGEVQTLFGVSLSVAVGKVTCIMGRNGVGKTTLLRNIMGVLKPRSGVVTLGDTVVTTKPSHARAKLGLSLVPQGLYQAYHSITTGFWYARSPEIIHSPVMETLVWMRVPGDIVFSIGAVLLALFMAKLLIGPRAKQPVGAPEPRPVPEPAMVPAE